MLRFKAIPISDSSPSGKWGVEKTIPGEKPTLTRFLGTRAEAQDEATRLNLYSNDGN